MICPKCKHPGARVLRTRPDPDEPSQELIRKCRACGLVFATAETHIREVKTHDPGHFLDQVVALLEAMPANLRAQVRERLKTL